MSATQAPRFIPRAAYDQVKHVFIWPVRDQEGLRRIEEIAGLGRHFRSALEAMAWHDVMYVRPPGEPVITRLDRSRVPAPPAPPARADDASSQGSRADERPEPRKSDRRGWFW